MKKTDISQQDLFSATHWSVVNEARNLADDRRAQAALATLCETYWHPVYAYILRRGNDSHRAEDITQGFFLVFIEKFFLKSADQEKGKFRAFLLASIKNYMANLHDYETAKKRGGKLRIHSIHDHSTHGHDPGTPHNATVQHDKLPPEVFDHDWAITLLRSVQQTLKGEYEKAGNGALFAAIYHTLTTASDSPERSYDAIAKELQMSEGAVKVAVHRLRQRYKKRLREAVGHTVSHKSAIDEELQHLINSL